jgi:hypothetical protein
MNTDRNRNRTRWLLRKGGVFYLFEEVAGGIRLTHGVGTPGANPRLERSSIYTGEEVRLARRTYRFAINSGFRAELG